MRFMMCAEFLHALFICAHALLYKTCMQAFWMFWLNMMSDQVVYLFFHTYKYDDPHTKKRSLDCASFFVCVLLVDVVFHFVFLNEYYAQDFERKSNLFL